MSGEALKGCRERKTFPSHVIPEHSARRITKRNEVIMLIHDLILGVGVLMLLVLTIERYVSVCHPSHMRPALGPPR